jgi:surface carbohydrate biosynthesis protein
MRILISYHNFVRDYRGSLLLKYALEALGHRVWLRPHWDDEISFATVKEVDVIVACQIAEESTSYIAKFASDHGVHLVVNSSEHFASPEWFESFVTYDCNQLSDGVISMQPIATAELKEFIDRHPRIRHRDKYKLLGFPRLDISLDPELRDVERNHIEQTYGLGRFKRRLLYISSLIFEETFTDVGNGDMEKWQYHEVIDTNHALRRFHEPILKGLVERYLGPDGVLLIKKHPWDMSDHFERRFKHPNVCFLDHAEYIVPCLASADAVVHSFSTSAIEAWILGKPTVALLPTEKREKLSLSHMRDEVFAGSLDEAVACLRSYPRTGLMESVRTILGPNADGKATIRLAREIHKLRPKSGKTLRRPRLAARARGELRWWLHDVGIRRRDFINPNLNQKMRRLAEWEGLRDVVRSRYDAAFRAYIQRHQAELLA